MPRYVYYCPQCDNHFQTRHGMKEIQVLCQLCKEHSHLQRVPQMPSIKKEKISGKQADGSLTKNYIEQNREVLRDMKKEARNKEHDS